MKMMECIVVVGKTRPVHDTKRRDGHDMLETCWIRRWYFLYISVSDMLKNFHTTCHAEVMSSRKLSDSLKKARANSQKKMMSFMADQIARIVPKIVTEIQGSNTPPSFVDSKTEKPNPTKFSYKHFFSCNPKPFTGSDGVTTMLEWFDSIEVTFINSECPEHLKTRSATGMFQGRALEWWSNERNIRSNEEAFALPWPEVRELMMLEFYPPHEQLKLEEEF
ncbi:hypothetical protein Hanom_Chr09g00797721 [Helianthus anomalus]